MKIFTRNKLASSTIAAVVLLSLNGTGAIAATSTPTHTIEYTYTNAEESIAAMPDSDLVLTNSAKVNGTSVVGMTDSYVYDAVKGKNVRSLGFNKKEAGENTKGASVVRASLDGFAKYMTDADVNTISFDYKISGTSDGAIGMFMGSNVEDFGDQIDTAILIGNTTGINITPRINRNTTSDWYAYAKNIYEHTIEARPNNREWNRITVEINKKNGDVAGYINGEYFSFDTNTGVSANPPTDMNSFLFQTAAAVENDGDLTILLDNIKVYAGKSKFTSASSFEGIWNFETGLKIENFGFIDSAGVSVTKAQSDVCVNTKLTNNSENGIKLLIFISGYNDGVMESVDLKLCEIAAGENIVINNSDNKLTLDTAKNYDKIQLRILDGESGYPIIEQREIVKATE